LGKSANRYNADVANAKTISDSERREIDRDEAFRRGGSIAESIFGMEEGFSRMTGDPSGVRRARLSAQNFTAFSRVGQARRGLGEYLSVLGDRTAATFGNIFDEQVGRQEAEQKVTRGRDYAVEDARMAAGVDREILARNPLAARQAALEAERTRAVRGRTHAERDAINEAFGLRRQAMDKASSDVIALRDTALVNRGAELRVLTRNDRYAGVAAQSLEAKDAAFLRVMSLEQTNGGGANNNAIRQVLQNAQTEQQVLTKQLLRTFDTAAISINQTDLSGGGHGGNVQRSLDDIARNTADTSRKLDNLGRAQ
jgi:hypothetical protein